jgi:carbon-monoxide dehydrogenase large subunit
VFEEIRPKLVGARVKRVEDPRLLAGKGTYVDDLRIAGTVCVAFLRSMHAHARITRIETISALGVRGVIGIFAGKDIEALVRPISARSRMKSYHATAMPLLAVDKVRYAGEPVVAVVAENRYVAEDAVERLEVDYDPLPAAVDPEEAAREDAPLLHDDAESNVLVAREFARGDVAAALSQAKTRVRERFRFHRKAALAIEPRTYLADFNSGNRSLTLHSTTQVPGIIRDALADLLDIPGHSIRVVAPDVGGGFGGKSSVYPEEVLVCLLSRRLGRPVKWTSDRLEDLQSTTQAFDEIVDAEIGFDGEGKIVGLQANAIGDVGAYSVYPWTAALEPVQVVSFLPGPYRMPAYRGSVRGVATPKAPMGPYRGVGRPISTFVTERLLDLAAGHLGADPVDLRLRNLIRDEEFPYKTASGIVWDGAAFVECLKRARDAIGYEDRRREQTEGRAHGRWLGIGFACYAELTGIGSRISASPGMPINTGTESATIRVDPTGAVTAMFGIASHGQGLETSLAQVVADELGVPLESVRVLHGDTAVSVSGSGTYASRSAVLAGGAGTLAARAVREKVLRAASYLLEVPPPELELVDGRIFARALPERGLTLRELARAVYSEIGRLPREAQDTLEATKLYDPYFGTTSTATHAALVEVDVEQCGVKVVRYLVAEDCGKIINPLIVDGQVHGGVAQGIGAALLEDVVYDAEGQLLTGSLMDYLVPSAPEIPDIEVLHVETDSKSTLGGFRGMGEGGTIGAPAAIANAVADALAPLRVRIDELPITPDRLFELIRAARAQHSKEDS